MKPLLFAGMARRRLRTLPPGPPPPELLQAKADFIEAVISRNYRAAKAANAVIARCSRPEPPPSSAERAKRERRYKAHRAPADDTGAGGPGESYGGTISALAGPEPSCAGIQDRIGGLWRSKTVQLLGEGQMGLAV
jgi:hypothetical protein